MAAAGGVTRPRDGTVLLADTSAWRRAARPLAREGWLEALGSGRIATCSIVMLELLFSTKTEPEFARLDRALRDLPEAPVTRTVMDAALAAMGRLAGRLKQQPGHHRVPPADLILAAAAEEAGFGVLHYDHHFDRLAEVLSFESRWLAPPGSLD